MGRGTDGKPRESELKKSLRNSLRGERKPVVSRAAFGRTEVDRTRGCAGWALMVRGERQRKRKLEKAVDGVGKVTKLRSQF